jgi:voltage-gated potassium channel Kch
VGEHDADRSHTSRSRRGLHALQSQVRPGSFAVLLIAAATVYVLNALAIASTAGSLLAQLARLGLMFASVYVLSGRRVTAWLGTLLGATTYTLDVVILPIDPRLARLLQDSLTAGFSGWILVVVLREVFRPTTTERNAVVGALAGFLLILTVFTRLHGLVETLSPGAYHTDGGALAERGTAYVVATFQYFSTVTLTTVGFGDIVPLTRLARLLTGVEAIVGQFYVAVVIAALVGRAVAGRSTDRSS